MSIVRRYWWVLPAVVAGAYWIWRAWVLEQYDTLIVATVVLAVVLAVYNVVNPARRRREIDDPDAADDEPD